MNRRPPRSTRTDTLFPYTTLFRSQATAWNVPVVGSLRRPRRLSRSESSPAALRVKVRSEEHTSELQSLMRISYAVFCLKKKQIPLHISANNRFNVNKILFQAQQQTIQFKPTLSLPYPHYILE